MVGDQINFVRQQQEQTNWCWAATAASVAAYYDVNTPWFNQCALANDQLPGAYNCCNSSASLNCNQTWYVTSALQRVGRLDQVQSGSASLGTLQEKIAQRRPVVAVIRWSDGKQHFPLISGWFQVIVSLIPFVQEIWLTIEDPYYGTVVLSYDRFRTAYQGSGQWVYTCYTA
jgi:Papain-like cysteine protease AvrRpt2